LAQVPLAENHDMVEAFPPERANQPFRMPILPWRAWRNRLITNAHGTKPPGENLRICLAGTDVEQRRGRLRAIASASWLETLRASNPLDVEWVKGKAESVRLMDRNEG
jgi:hypothetical protein